MYFNRPTSLVPQGQDGDRDRDGDSMLSAA